MFEAIVDLDGLDLGYLSIANGGEETNLDGPTE